MDYGIGKMFLREDFIKESFAWSGLGFLVDGNFLKEFVGCHGISSAVAYLNLGYIENTLHQVADKIRVNQANHITSTKLSLINPYS